MLYTPYFTQALKQGWPFRSRCFQSRRATQAYIEEDGYAKSTLMSSPRLHGLIGANNNGGNKKPHPTMASKPDESEFPSTTTTPSQHQGYPSPAPYSNHFPGRNTNSNSNSPPQNVLESLHYYAELPLRPVRLGTSLTRFDIGAWSRSPTTLLHSSSSSRHPK